MGPSPSIFIAFGAGALSFISPCCLPLYPSFLSYMAGVSFTAENPGLKDRLRLLTHALLFVLGFSIVFFALGLSATLLGQLFAEYHVVIRIAGGALVFLMGVLLTGIIPIRFASREVKWHYRGRRLSYVSSILIGISFSAGWTPCIGPILSSVLVMTATESAHGIFLIIAYILGFAVPFVALALTMGSVRRFARASYWISKVGGVIMMVMGVLLMTDAIAKITVWFIRLYGGFMGL